MPKDDKFDFFEEPGEPTVEPTTQKTPLVEPTGEPTETKSRGPTTKQLQAELAEFKMEIKTELAEIRSLVKAPLPQPAMPPSPVNIARVAPILASIARKVMFWNGTPFGQECLDLLLEVDPKWGAEVQAYVKEKVLPSVKRIVARKAAIKGGGSGSE